MTWSLGESLTEQHRDRLLAAGVLPEVLADLDLRQVRAPLPEWWHEQHNALYLHGNGPIPTRLIEQMALLPFGDALIVICSTVENMAKMHLGGDGATVFLGPGSSFTATDIWCGAGSTIVLNRQANLTRAAVLDARNGGSIVAGPDQLWAADVYVATDDMHRVEDAATGQRLNPFGAHIRLGSHVWLGRDVIVTGHADIGDGAIVGMRSMVRGGKVPARTAVAGTPAQVVREDVVWTEDDTP